VVRLSEDVRGVVDRELGFVATVCPDGTPNLSPKGTIAVWDDEHVVFADLRSPGTIANLAAQPVVDINVVDQLSRKGYRIKGTATVHTEGEVFERGLAFYTERGTVRADERIRSIVIVAVEHIAAVTSPAYDLGRTETELRSTSLQRLLDGVGPND
jgi:predicted pyridoxine 5'-phosphate oxidase superfamily flavin-nucleotide-binding protein